MVQLRTTKRGRWQAMGNRNGELGLKRISCVSQLTIPDMAGRSSNPAGMYTDTRASELTQASRTAEFSYLLVYSISFSSSSTISIFLIHISTIITEHKVKSSLSISPCHDQDLTPSTVLHWVQHTPSTAHCKYSIHREQHTPNTACTEYCLLSLHSDVYELTPDRSFSFRSASLQIDWHQPALHKSLNGKVTSLQFPGFELPNPWIEPPDHLLLPSTASRSTPSEYSFNVARS